MNGNLKLKELKLEERPVKSLNHAQIRQLLKAAEIYPTIKMRILLALGTGLRRGDIESLKITDIDFEKNSITTTSKKTKKSMANRPVPESIMKMLKIYINKLSPDQGKFPSNDTLSSSLKS